MSPHNSRAIQRVSGSHIAPRISAERARCYRWLPDSGPSNGVASSTYTIVVGAIELITRTAVIVVVAFEGLHESLRHALRLAPAHV